MDTDRAGAGRDAAEARHVEATRATLAECAGVTCIVCGAGWIAHDPGCSRDPYRPPIYALAGRLYAACAALADATTRPGAAAASRLADAIGLAASAAAAYEAEAAAGRDDAR